MWGEAHQLCLMCALFDVLLCLGINRASRKVRKSPCLVVDSIGVTDEEALLIVVGIDEPTGDLAGEAATVSGAQALFQDIRRMAQPWSLDTFDTRLRLF
jgi:hypothetical protein